MSESAIRSYNSMRLHKHVDSLTSTQKQFYVLLCEWLQNPRHMLIVVSGGPGTGKTYSVIETLNLIHCNQIRMAPTGRIAQKIKGKTIHSTFKLDWRPGSVLHNLEKYLSEMDYPLTKCIEMSDVLQKEFNPPYPNPRIAVLDEVGMISSWFTMQIIKYLIHISEFPILIVVMGDKHQLKPVRSNENLFDIPFLRDHFETHYVELTESKRFRPEYHSIVQQLCQYVDKGNEDGLFAFLCQEFPVVDSIDSDILMKCTRVLAFRNSTVDNYNSFYVDKMLKGQTIRLYQIKQGKKQKKYIDVKCECLLIVTQNLINVKNGTPVIFKKYDSIKDYILCTTMEGENISIPRNNEGVFPISINFASTVHKFQGETIDDPKIAINFDGCKDLNLVYTALSRVKSMDQIEAIVL